MKNLGGKWTNSQVDQMWEKADADGSGALLALCTLPLIYWAVQATYQLTSSVLHSVILT